MHHRDDVSRSHSLTPARSEIRQRVLDAISYDGTKVSFRDAILQAVEAEDLELFKNLLSSAVYVEWCSRPEYICRFIVNEAGENLLHVFAAKNLVHGFSLLQNIGEHRNSSLPYSAYRDGLCMQNNRGETPLHTAVIWNHNEAVKAIYRFFSTRTIDDTLEPEHAEEEEPLDEEWRLPLQEFLAIKNNAGRNAIEESDHLGNAKVTAWLRHVAKAQGVLTETGMIAC